MKAAFALAAAVASFQQAPAAPTTSIGASRLVLVTATDARNRPLVDIGPDDFVIQEGATTRDVLSVHAADYPILVLLGTGTDAGGDFAGIQKAASRFIERLGDARPIAVATFGGAPRLVATFDDDRRTVLMRINALSAEGAPGRQVLRGAALAARTLHATESLFTAIVVISGVPVDASTDEDALGPLVDGGTILHVIVNRGSPGSPETVRTFVDQTLGVYTPVYSVASLQPALDRLADRLTAELLVEYLVPPGSRASDVKVGIRVPGARVRGLGVAPR
jgi:hypothetical protein